jgi:hypothetical protein
VRQQAGLGAERADVEETIGSEFVQHVGVRQHPGLIQPQHRIKRAR